MESESEKMPKLTKYLEQFGEVSLRHAETGIGLGSTLGRNFGIRFEGGGKRIRNEEYDVFCNGEKIGRYTQVIFSDDGCVCAQSYFGRLSDQHKNKEKLLWAFWGPDSRFVDRFIRADSYRRIPFP